MINQQAVVIEEMFYIYMTHNGVCLEVPAVSIQILSPGLRSECEFFT